jgi:biopolymer transport protein ExbD
MPPKGLARAGLVAVVIAVLMVWILKPLAELEQIWVLIQFACLLLGLAGAMLLLRALGGWLLGGLAGKQELRIFPGMALRNVIPMQRHRPMPLMKGFPNFGLAFGGFFLVVVFIFMILETPRTSRGLLMDIRERTAMAGRKSPWAETLGVYVDGRGQFYVNGKAVAREKLRAKLQEELGRQAVWTVYFEANRDCTFMNATYAFDTIQGLGAKVVWITPRVREELSRAEVPQGKAAGE